MLPSNFGALGVLLLSIIPGFIATSVWARARPWRGPEGNLRTVLQSLTLSVVIQLLLSPLTLVWLYPVRHRLEEFPERTATWVGLVVLVVPVLLGLVAGKLTNVLSDPESLRVRGRFRRALARLWPAPAPPSVWDWVFSAKPPHGSFVVVEFLDGRRIAGVFAEGSLALTSPEPQGLFLVSEWELNEFGDIIGPLPDTSGVMILRTDEVRSVRILSGERKE